MSPGFAAHQEQYQLYRDPDIVTAIKGTCWAGHVWRLDNSEIPKGVIEYKPEGRQRVGKFKLHWIEGVVEDLKKLGVKSWWTAARNSEPWRRILEKAEARTGL